MPRNLEIKAKVRDLPRLTQAVEEIARPGFIQLRPLGGADGAVGGNGGAPPFLADPVGLCQPDAHAILPLGRQRRGRPAGG